MTNNKLTQFEKFLNDYHVIDKNDKYKIGSFLDKDRNNERVYYIEFDYELSGDDLEDQVYLDSDDEISFEYGDDAPFENIYSEKTSDLPTEEEFYEDDDFLLLEPESHKDSDYEYDLSASNIDRVPASYDEPASLDYDIAGSYSIYIILYFVEK